MLRWDQIWSLLYCLPQLTAKLKCFLRFSHRPIGDVIILSKLLTGQNNANPSRLQPNGHNFQAELTIRWIEPLFGISRFVIKARTIKSFDQRYSFITLRNTLLTYSHIIIFIRLSLQYTSSMCCIHLYMNVHMCTCMPNERNYSNFR